MNTKLIITSALAGLLAKVISEDTDFQETLINELSEKFNLVELDLAKEITNPGVNWVYQTAMRVKVEKLYNSNENK